MMRQIALGLLIAAAAAGCGRGLAHPQGSGEAISLAGDWRFALDRQDQGIAERWHQKKLEQKIELPGVLTAQGYGDEPSFETRWTGDGWRYPEMFKEYQKPENFKFPFFLQPPRHYVGPAWYQRDIQIPSAWQGKRIVLRLERPHWQTMVWLDGKQIGAADSLGVAHEHELGVSLRPGTHVLTIRVDNRLNINVGPLSHSVTDHTQGNWNGIVGRIEIRAGDMARVDDVRLFPDVANKRVRVEVSAAGCEAGKVVALARSVSDGWESQAAQADVVNGKAQLVVELGPQARLWDEFSPALYDLELSLDCSQGRERRTIRFGLREVGAREGRITINGRKTFLRGTLECCIFPLTGHPPTDVESWRRIVRICKDHGLNHMRFHSWCPPEAAFVAADELGFYYHVEVSSWANQGAEIGSGTSLDQWIECEADRMVKAYGNHPSFIMMCYGNEPAGKNHKKWLAEFVTRWKQKDSRRLYTTGAGWPILSGSDYHSSPDARIQRWGEGLKSILNAKPPSTDFDWSDYVKKYSDAPIVSHEIGQWCVYPNFDEMEKYTGYFKPRNFEVFKEVAERNGLLNQAHDFLIASGKLQALAYKHEIEAALRTPNFGGFQLLDLHDFPGQGTALVGVLDAFWGSKGYIAPAEFRRFCGPVVPLARMKNLVLKMGDSLEAQIELAQFGPADLKQVGPRWQVVDAGNRTIASGKLPAGDFASGELHTLGSIKVRLDTIKAPARLSLAVSVGGYSNSWDVFVYPKQVETSSPPQVLVTASLDEAINRLKAGGRVLWLPPASAIKNDPQRPLQMGFSPIFWNTAWTKWQPPHTLGILCNPRHPALAGFPTQSHSNWQWWELTTGGAPFILTDHRDLKPVVQVIDDWFTSRKLALVFEARVGSGRLIACGADLRRDLDSRPAARQFLRSLLDYAGGQKFEPKITLSEQQLRGMAAP